MHKRVEVVVGPKGEVEADFVGFRGGDCEPEADALARALASLGVRVSLVSKKIKSPREVLEEVGPDERRRGGARVGGEGGGEG